MPEPGGRAGTNQTEPRFLRGTTASSHAELYVISNEQVLLAHALLYQNRHYNKARQSLLLRRAPEQLPRRRSFSKSSTGISSGSLAREGIAPSGMYSPCRQPPAPSKYMPEPGGRAGTNQTEPRFLRGTTASSHAELYVISNEQVLLAHALLYQNRHYKKARHSLLLRRHQSSCHEGGRFLKVRQASRAVRLLESGSLLRAFI